MARFHSSCFEPTFTASVTGCGDSMDFLCFVIFSGQKNQTIAGLCSGACRPLLLGGCCLDGHVHRTGLDQTRPQEWQQAPSRRGRCTSYYSATLPRCQKNVIKKSSVKLKVVGSSPVIGKVFRHHFSSPFPRVWRWRMNTKNTTMCNLILMQLKI